MYIICDVLWAFELLSLLMLPGHLKGTYSIFLCVAHYRASAAIEQTLLLEEKPCLCKNDIFTYDLRFPYILVCGNNNELEMTHFFYFSNSVLHQFHHS